MNADERKCCWEEKNGTSIFPSNFFRPAIVSPRNEAYKRSSWRLCTLYSEEMLQRNSISRFINEYEPISDICEGTCNSIGEWIWRPFFFSFEFMSHCSHLIDTDRNMIWSQIASPHVACIVVSMHTYMRIVRRVEATNLRLNLNAIIKDLSTHTLHAKVNEISSSKITTTEKGVPSHFAQCTHKQNCIK